MKPQALAGLALKRIGDPERNIVIERLRQAYVNGEIDANVHSDRVASALKARNEVQLRLLVWDLIEREPEPDPGPDFSQTALDQWRAAEGRRIDQRGVLRGIIAVLATQLVVGSLVAAALFQPFCILGVLVALVAAVFLPERLR